MDGSVTALDDDTTFFLEAASPWNEGASFQLSGNGVTGSEAGVLDPNFILTADGASFDIKASGPARVQVYPKPTGGPVTRVVPQSDTHVVMP